MIKGERIFTKYMDKKKITVGVPCYKAQNTILDLLSSVNIQTIRDDVEVILGCDFPEDDYEFVKDKFPNLDIKILPCTENTGPGLARQRCLDAATTDWITFIDADDVFFTPLALENMWVSIEKSIIEVQTVFLQETAIPGKRLIPQTNINHPWVFGRLYNVQFLRQMDIRFSSLRAMEDGEFNWKIRLAIEGTQWNLKVVQDNTYMWRMGSEHSITRIGVDDKGIPQYNYDLCQWGATAAAISAIKFARKVNPFAPSTLRFAVEQMVGQYFTYIETLNKKPIFAEQNLFNAKRFYHECYKDYDALINNELLQQVYTVQRAQKGQDLLGIIPEITFFDFLKKVKEDHYGGDEEFAEIRSKLPEEVIENDKKCGVLQS